MAICIPKVRIREKWVHPLAGRDQRCMVCRVFRLHACMVTQGLYIYENLDWMFPGVYICVKLLSRLGSAV